MPLWQHTHLYFTVNISFFYVAGDLAGHPGTPTFVCTPGENIELDALCDGVRDCTNGDDENSTLCESMSTNKTYYFLVAHLWRVILPCGEGKYQVFEQTSVWGEEFNKSNSSYNARMRPNKAQCSFMRAITSHEGIEF